MKIRLLVVGHLKETYWKEAQNEYLKRLTPYAKVDIEEVDDLPSKKGDSLAEMEEVKNADMIFAVGGGRAVDTCKTAADLMHKPLFTFPTLGSNCAGCTAIALCA